ncbi:MAG: hypothetical protein K2G03_04355 [Bacilli bacterium]|nr:hypothetical protein [Bacilli bacterium]
MTKNKKKFIVSIIGAIIIFLLGITYISMPTYYGIDLMENIEINNLFISFAIIYATINLGTFLMIGKNPNNESINLCIVGSIVGILNIILSNFTDKSFMISFAILVFLITAVKLFTVDYYHDRKDAYYYIEGLCLCIFFIVGLVTALNLFGSSFLQTMMLGFFITIMGILKIFNISIKTMLKSKRFLRKIKLK